MARFDAPIYGTFVHAVLEQTVREVMRQGGFGTVSAQQAADITAQAIAQFTQAHAQELAAQPARAAYLFERNLDEVRAVAQELWRELHSSAFAPAH